MAGAFTTIRTCASSIEAELLRHRLANAGIESHLLDEGVGGFSGGLSPHREGIRLQVASEEFERASQILDHEGEAK